MTLVLFPFKLEMDHFLKKVEKRGSVPKDWICAFGGHGKVQMALATQGLGLQHPEVQAIFCLGSAGALDKKLKISDVVCGEFTVEHDFKVRTRETALPQFPGHKETLDLIREFQPVDFALHFGKIASGDEDVVDRQRAMELNRDTGALCVAWEGAGAARAAKLLKKPFLEIRTITDFSHASTGREFELNLEKAMGSLADVMLALNTGSLKSE